MLMFFKSHLPRFYLVFIFVAVTSLLQLQPCLGSVTDSHQKRTQIHLTSKLTPANPVSHAQPRVASHSSHQTHDSHTHSHPGQEQPDSDSDDCCQSNLDWQDRGLASEISLESHPKVYQVLQQASAQLEPYLYTHQIPAQTLRPRSRDPVLKSNTLPLALETVSFLI